jgi:hypothetical protein
VFNQTAFYSSENGLRIFRGIGTTAGTRYGRISVGYANSDIDLQTSSANSLTIVSKFSVLKPSAPFLSNSDNWVISFGTNNRIFAIDNDNLVLVASTGASNTYVYDVVITGSTGITTNLFVLTGALSGNSFVRDLKISTENKVLVIGLDGSGDTYLQQYDYSSGATLDVEISLSGITNVASLVEVNDQFYILNNSNEIYQIGLTPPYLITYEDTSTTPIGFGNTSQRYGCITQKFEV